MRLAIVLAEFEKAAPDVSQYRQCWPDADIHVFGDSDVPRYPQFEGPRYGWRANDYWTVRKALDCGADVAICVDADMRIVDMSAMRMLPLISQRFGVCLPLNPRYIVERDYRDGADTAGFARTALDAFTISVNCSPVAINLNNEESVALAEAYCEVMLANPMRGPLAWTDAMHETGVVPMILPPQWCVCERHIGIGNEIMIHEGHEAVKRHYAAFPTR